MASFANCNVLKEVSILVIDGNIGSGKSTTLREISSNNLSNLLSIFPEPIDVWSNYSCTERTNKTYNFLDQFYKEPKEFCFQFQTLILTSLFNRLDGALKQNEDSKFLFFERSAAAALEVFSKSANLNGNLSDMELELLWYIQTTLSKQNSLFSVDNKNEKVFYLRVPPEVCFNRLKQRARTEEVGVSLQYLQQLHALYEQLYANSDSVVIVDGCLDLKTIRIEIEKHLELW